MSECLITGIGQSCVFITDNIDLSIGSVVGMGTMIAATLMICGVNPMAAMLIIPVCCLTISVVGDILVGKFQLPPSIATLETMLVARGVAYMINGNYNTDAISSGIDKEVANRSQTFFYYGKMARVFNAFWVALVLSIASFFLLSKTRIGCRIYTTGSNTEVTKLSGVSVTATVIKTYLVSTFYSFVVGPTLCGQADMDNIETGSVYKMCIATADVIGNISSLGEAGILLETFVGVTVWQTLGNKSNMVGIQVGIQRLVTGIIVAFAVLLGVALRKEMLIRKCPVAEKKVQEFYGIRRHGPISLTLV